jgi:predicted PurR-regulated permease PerM
MGEVFSIIMIGGIFAGAGRSGYEACEQQNQINSDIQTLQTQINSYIASSNKLLNSIETWDSTVQSEIIDISQDISVTKKAVLDDKNKFKGIYLTYQILVIIIVIFVFFLLLSKKLGLLSWNVFNVPKKT